MVIFLSGQGTLGPTPPSLGSLKISLSVQVSTRPLSSFQEAGGTCPASQGTL